MYSSLSEYAVAPAIASSSRDLPVQDRGGADEALDTPTQVLRPGDAQHHNGHDELDGVYAR